MSRYVFREVLPIRGAKNLDADRVGAIIEALPGDDKPGSLVREARAPSHYLHGCFDWNDRTAAEAHRLATARQVIRCVMLVDDEKPTAPPVPAFVSISVGKDGGDRQYFTPPQITDNAALQLRLMRGARNDLLAWLRRYEALRSISPLVAVVVERLDAEIAAAVEGATTPEDDVA
jgi:hypothetical protein